MLLLVVLLLYAFISMIWRCWIILLCLCKNVCHWIYNIYKYIYMHKETQIHGKMEGKEKEEESLALYSQELCSSTMGFVCTMASFAHPHFYHDLYQHISKRLVWHVYFPLIAKRESHFCFLSSYSHWKSGLSARNVCFFMLFNTLNTWRTTHNCNVNVIHTVHHSKAINACTGCPTHTSNGTSQLSSTLKKVNLFHPIRARKITRKCFQGNVIDCVIQKKTTQTHNSIIGLTKDDVCNWFTFANSTLLCIHTNFEATFSFFPFSFAMITAAAVLYFIFIFHFQMSPTENFHTILICIRPTICFPRLNSK